MNLFAKESKKSIYDIVDRDVMSELIKHDSCFSLSKIFSPHLAKFVNYTPKLCCSSRIDKFDKRLNIKSDRRILDFMEIFYSEGLNPVLCGGKLIDYVNGKTFDESINDYDLYFTNELDSQKMNNLVYQWLGDTNGSKAEKLGFKITADLPYLIELSYKRKDEAVETIKIQVMRKIYSCVEEIIEGFDLRCCSFAYYNKTMYWMKGAIKDVRDKKLTLLSPRSDINIFTRIIKYCQRGYSIATSDLLAASVLALEPIVIRSPLEHDHQAIDIITNRDTIFDRTLGYETLNEEEIVLTPQVI